MSTRVVSKRTKLLFIGFGAAAIATACIVSTMPTSQTATAGTISAPAMTVPAHK